MATLLTVEDVQALIKEGGRSIRVGGGTLITPSAKDAARDAGIEIEYDFGGPCGSRGDSAEGVDPELICRALSVMKEKGMLDIPDVDCAAGACSAPAPYKAEIDASGLKIVKGDTVRMEFLETGDPNNDVRYQEAICSGESRIFNAGFLEIDGCSFDWEVGCDEMYYVIAGPLEITVNGGTYVAEAGDVVNLPVGHTVALSARGKARLFYGIKAA